MFTSPEPLTGKTTIASNLAFALAEDTNRRVALIEANFRFPRFSEIFQLPERIGLMPILEGKLQIKDYMLRNAPVMTKIFTIASLTPLSCSP